MADPRFFTNRGPVALGDMARIARAELVSTADPARLIHDVGSLEAAGPDDVGFFDNDAYIESFRNSRAGACFVRPRRVDDAPEGMALLVTDDPYWSYAATAWEFYPEDQSSGAVTAQAMVDPTAVLGEGTTVHPGAVIEAGVETGPGCVIGPNAVIRRNVVMGADCRIEAAASLAYCRLGNRVRIYAGARIGEPGFGFASGPEGHLTVPQLGRVIVGDDVEIGANSTIDRGAGPDTVIGDGCRIDNLVQIGHNVQLGRGCIIVAQVGISGSTKLEDFVVVAGQAGMSGHLTIGRGARIGAQAGVIRDVPAGASLFGTPAIPVKQFFRRFTLLARLAGKKGE